MVSQNNAIHQIFLGGCSPEAEALGKSFFGDIRTSSRVPFIQNLGYELFHTLQKAEFVLLTGGYDRAESWPPINIIADVYRMFTGDQLDASQITPLTERGTLCAYKLSLVTRTLYLTSGDVRMLPMSYRCVLHDIWQRSSAQTGRADRYARPAIAEPPYIIHDSMPQPDASWRNTQYTPWNNQQIKPQYQPAIPAPPIHWQEQQAVYNPEPSADFFPTPAYNSSAFYSAPPSKEDVEAERRSRYLDQINLQHKEDLAKMTRLRSSMEEYYRQNPPAPVVFPAERVAVPAPLMPQPSRTEFSPKPKVHTAKNQSEPPVVTRTKKAKPFYTFVTVFVFLAFVFSVGFLTYRGLESSTAARQSNTLKNIYNSGTENTVGDTTDYDYLPASPSVSETPDRTPALGNEVSPVTETPPEVEASPDTGSPSNSGSGGTQTSSFSSLDLLKSINPDTIGWITIPGTPVDGPIVQSSPYEPEYYLEHDFYKQSSYIGTLYLDSENVLGSTKNLTVYGHHIQSSSVMFGELKSYLDGDFYKAHPDFTLHTNNGNGKWGIFAVILVTPDTESPDFFEWRKANFTDDGDFISFIDDVRSRSVVLSDMTVSPGDNLINLVTCYNDQRLVVFARELREGEIT